MLKRQKGGIAPHCYSIPSNTLCFPSSHMTCGITGKDVLHVLIEDFDKEQKQVDALNTLTWPFLEENTWSFCIMQEDKKGN